ncbi:MAG: Stp1/IreP family PP2C-type Ser/Thr phosphatase [Desulfobacterales bacterium]|nr:Stp1/IreP family PP2C-type Ser/Thr phosphatase [Desulfobacterales bacterium]
MKLIRRLFGFSHMSGTVYGATDVGRIRKNNEDCFLIRPEKNLFIAADGMGGHNAGEVASAKAVESVDKYFTRGLVSEIMGDGQKIEREMILSLYDAHKKVHEMAKNKSEYRGMGCTIVVAFIDDNTLHVCHVGDARAYLCNNTGIKLLTSDHSVVMSIVKAGNMTIEEARTSPIKNELTQAIGGPGTIEPDYNHYPLKNRDKILLCSDGLWDMLADSVIHEIIKRNKPAKAICEELIVMANKAGGKDNITTVLAVHKARDDVFQKEDTLDMQKDFIEAE